MELHIIAIFSFLGGFVGSIIADVIADLIANRIERKRISYNL